MTFQYQQSSGEFRADGALWGVGYAGHGVGKNNPAAQDVHNVGPLPVGRYTIGNTENHPKTGPVSIRLIPDPSNRMFGRSAFLIHGDNKTHDASEGCIILGPVARRRISAMPGTTLEVIA